MYVPALSNCEEISSDTAKHSRATGWSGGSFKNSERYESNLTAIDPLTGEVKKNVHLRYPNYSGAISTGGGLVFIGLLDGTIAALDEVTLEQLWKINVGSGFTAPPMTYSVDGKQYVAVVAGGAVGVRAGGLLQPSAIVAVFVHLLGKEPLGWPQIAGL